jgi:DNA polymerase (family 10)
MRLREAQALVRELRRTLRLDGKRPRMRVVGSVRRKEAAPHDVDILVVADDPPLGRLALGSSATMRMAPGGAAGPRHRRVVFVAADGRHLPADFFWARPAELPFAMLHYTGPKERNIHLRVLAKKRGYTLNQYALEGYRGPPPRTAKEVVAILDAR